MALHVRGVVVGAIVLARAGVVAVVPGDTAVPQERQKRAPVRSGAPQ
jgi:hypothetical protein